MHSELVPDLHSPLTKEPDKVKSMMEDCNYEADMDGEPWELLRTLAHTLGKQKALLHETIPIQKDISMYNDLGVISTTFGDLCAVVSTPIPFPLFNLMQVLLSVWVFAVPFFQTNYSLKNLPFIFFAIYVRVGLNVVACEITDPFGGDDLNDVEVKIFAKVGHFQAACFYVPKSLATLPFLIFNFSPLSYIKATIAQIKHILRDDLMHFFEVVPSDYGKSEDDAANTTFSSSSNSSQIGTFQYHSQLGISALKLQQCNEALSCFRQATCLVSSPRETATIMELIGDVYISQGRHGQANKCFEMASIASKAPQSVLLCSNILGMRVLRKLAELHFDSGQYRAALESYSELLPCYMDRHNRCEEETMIHLMHRIGLLCFLFGEHEKALNQFWSALRIKRDRMKYNNLSYFASLEGLKSRSDNLEVAHLLLCLGMVHQERGEIKLALSKCEEALVYHKILQLDGDVPLDMTSSLLARIGKLYAQIGKNADSNKTVSMMRILVPAILTNHRRTKYKQKSVCNNLPKGISWEDTQIISKTLHKASSPPTPANQKVSNAWHDDS